MRVFLSIPLPCLQESVQGSLKISGVLLKNSSDIFLAIGSLPESTLLNQNLYSPSEAPDTYWNVIKWYGQQRIKSIDTNKGAYEKAVHSGLLLLYDLDADQ